MKQQFIELLAAALNEASVERKREELVDKLMESRGYGAVGAREENDPLVPLGDGEARGMGVMVVEDECSLICSDKGVISRLPPGNYELCVRVLK